MDERQYDLFKVLRQRYYLSARCLLINQMFGAAGINFGYAVELTLKFILAFNKWPQKKLYNHNIKNYYQNVIDSEYIKPVNVSDNFINFVNNRLNARYPSYISAQFASYQAKQQAYAFTIDMLHCYDDFILQLDDAVTQAVKDPRISIGFRSCRELQSVGGRIFFHCNDHAFQRIPLYREYLRDNRDDGGNFEQIDDMLAGPEELWNFKGLIAYRPWGPKFDWAPAHTFTIPQFEGQMLNLRAAKWVPNESAIGTYLSSLEITLPEGQYEVESSDIVVPGKQSPRNNDKDD